MNQHGRQDGKAIRRLRKERGYRTVKSFALRVGIKPQSLSNIERGNRPAGIDVLVTIAGALGVPVDTILKVGDKAEAEAEEVAA
jgi:transcriptional regulator with XRE-family HTH domain